VVGGRKGKSSAVWELGDEWSGGSGRRGGEGGEGGVGG